MNENSLIYIQDLSDLIIKLSETKRKLEEYNDERSETLYAIIGEYKYGWNFWETDYLTQIKDILEFQIYMISTIK